MKNWQNYEILIREKKAEMKTAIIKEIFDSIQGEGFYIGQKQLFIRFCGCNLNCAYCDTDFQKNETFFVHNLNKSYNNPIKPDELKNIISFSNAEMISLTGGEPLLYSDFLEEFLPLTNKKIYLETNGTLPEKLLQIINFVDVVSMDIKLYCSTKQENQFEKNIKFIKISKDANKEVFSKIILDKNYSKEELLFAIKFLKEYDVPLIIQPMDCKEKANELNKEELLKLFDFAASNYCNIRLIPQVHKFLNLL